jgi:hypothetical protein
VTNVGCLKASRWSLVALVAFACGGKTEVPDETGAGGGGSSGSAGGAGGASSGGATGGRGGAAGGSAGVGGRAGNAGSVSVGGAAGNAGMPGGAGGVTTGGAAGAGTNPDQLIDAVCKHKEAHGCPGGECRTTFRNNYDTNELWGCGDEWLGTQSCLLSDPTPCDYAAECADELAIHEKCTNEADICIRGNRPEGGCVMGCERWTVDCRESSAGLHCTCTIGARAGVRFETTVACQSDEWLALIRASCE